MDKPSSSICPSCQEYWHFHLADDRWFLMNADIWKCQHLINSTIARILGFRRVQGACTSEIGISAQVALASWRERANA